MPNLNQVNMMGNLTRDPELRVTPKGTSICQFSIAINRSWKNESGKEQSEVTFVDCECWGKSGEAIAKYLTKGRPLFVNGRLKTDSWDDKETGKKRTKMKVVVERFEFIGGREDRQEGGQQEQAPRSSTPQESIPGDPDGPLPF